MSVADNEQVVMRAIDRMTKNESQPGISQLCRFVRRKFGLKSKVTRRVVKKLVEVGKVVKMENKEVESYRNALRLKMTKVTKLGEEFVCENHTFTSPKRPKVAVKKTTSQENSPITTTNDSPDTIPKIYQSDPYTTTPTISGPFSTTLLSYSLSLGDLEDMDIFQDHYPANWDHFRQNLSGSLTNQGKENYFEVGRFDTSGIFRFLPEAFFPPEMCQVLRKAKRGNKYVSHSSIVKNNWSETAPTTATTEGKCDFCQKGSNENKRGEIEDLLVCKDCSAKAHPTCMDYGTELAIRTKLAPWQCINCKTCTVCGDSENAETMLFCDFCDKGYHMSCHNPRVIEQPSGKWACQECAAELSIGPDPITNKEEPPETVMAHVSSDQQNAEPDSGTDQSSPNQIEGDNEQCLTPDGFLENYPQFIPDATYWTVEDVERFVAKVGFPEEARAFRDQEIDGKSLLLMKRSDVLTALSIRLGPALKIYKHVERLQLFLGSGLQS